MEKQLKKKITWVIKNFSSLQSHKVASDYFIVDGCRWNLQVYPKGNNVDYLSLFLEVANSQLLPIGWRRHAQYCFTLVNQCSEEPSHQRNELQNWFEQKFPSWGLKSMFLLNQIHAKDSGFLVNDELKIVAKVNVLEVIGKLDVLEETSTITETIDVNGFQLLPSQAKFVSKMLEKHPEITSNFRPKNSNLKTSYMTLLLSLIETIRKLPQKMSKDDIYDTYIALESMKDAGFNLDWLEKKLNEMLEKNENYEVSETGLQEMEEELKNLKLKFSDMEVLVEKEKKKMSVAKAPILFDDFV